MTVTRPQYLDGAEVYNPHTHHQSHNSIAEAWVALHGLRPLSGSDFHGGNSGDGVTSGGIVLNQPLSDSKALAQAVLAREYEILR